MRNVRIDDEITIATEAFGSADNPALVLVMGATASMLGWPHDLCQALASRGLYVIRYDHRDTGVSTTYAPGAANYSVEDMAGDLIGVMDGYNLEQAHIMGMSLGGFIGQIAALSDPDRIRSLTLLGSEPLGWDGLPLPHITPKFIDFFNRMGELDWSDRTAVKQFLLTIAELCSGSAYRFDAERTYAEIEAVLARTDSIASAFNHSMVELRGDWTGRFREIAQPVLVLHGEEDPVLPLANGEALSAGIRNARLIVLKGIGHELPAPLFATIATTVAEFIATARSTS